MCIRSVIPLPYYSFSPYHSMEDKYILGIGNGRTGALHNLSFGN
jgi:hypothetical protein